MNAVRTALAVIAIMAIACLCASAVQAAEPAPEAMFKRLSALASTGNADVKYHLGMLLNNGIGTARDNQEAFRLFSEAAQAGSALAAYKVGCYYADQFPGVVPASEELAEQFKMRSAEAGYDNAQLDIGMYFGKRRNVAAALMWWEKASRQGNQAATAYLANYLSGDASPDKVKAYALMQILKESMPTTPAQLIARIEKIGGQLSAAEKTEAERIRSSWMTGPTPLTATAREGISGVPMLITSLER